MLSLIFLLFVIGVPVGLALLAGSAAVLLSIGHLPLEMLAQRAISGIDFFPLLAIPFFILMAELMNRGGMTDSLIAFSNSLVGHMRGGIEQVNILSSIVMAGMSGSAVADASATTKIFCDASEKAGMSRTFSAAVTAASAIIGPIIPPSIPLILYGAITGDSVGRLFLGGAVPGMVIGLFLMIATSIIARRRGYPKGEWRGVGEIGRTTYRSLPALFAPVVILGGIFAGFFSPTEAAAFGCFYAMFTGTVIYRQLDLKKARSILLFVAAQSSVILFIIAAAAPYGWVLAWLQIPQSIASLIEPGQISATMLIVVIMAIVFVLGMFIESAPLMFLTTPALMPLVASFGIDPIHFGVVFVVTLMIGTVTPPVGVVLFAVMSAGGLKMEEVVRELLPYYVAALMALGVIIVFPDLVTWLPNLVFGPL